MGDLGDRLFNGRVLLEHAPRLGSPDDPIISDADPEETPSAEKLAGLMRAGLSDEQIANRLGVAPKQIVRWRKVPHLRRPGGRPIQ